MTSDVALSDNDRDILSMLLDDASRVNSERGRNSGDGVAREAARYYSLLDVVILDKLIRAKREGVMITNIALNEIERDILTMLLEAEARVDPEWPDNIDNDRDREAAINYIDMVNVLLTKLQTQH